ncbi:MAG: hypothetical protein AB7S36_03010 [Planctomycetota bacterium]
MRLPLAQATLLACLLAFHISTAHAQDSHYETNQYGSTSALRAGAVTGGVRDTSATWYNPAGLGFIENPSISVTASAYRLGISNIGDIAGTGTKLQSTPISTVPLIVSGLFMNDKAVPGHRFAFCLINRTISTIATSDRVRTNKDVLDRSVAETAGLEDYVGSFTLSTGVTEIWAGGAWGYHINDNVSIGAAFYVPMRQQSATFSAYARAVNPNANGVVATSDFTQSHDYLNLRLLGRLGLAFDLGPLKFGLAFTTPSASIFGKGGVLFQFTINDVDLDADNTGDSLVLEDEQRNLDAQFQSNMGLAFGIEYTIDEMVTFAFDVEWNAAAGRFNIMNPVARNLELGAGGGPAVLTTADFTPTYRYTSIVNVAFATTLRLDKGASVVLGFNTDFSYAPADSGTGTDLIFTDYDLFHFSGGLILSEYGIEEKNLGLLVREVSIGVVLSFGSGQAEQIVDFSSANESNFLMGLDTSKLIDVSYFSFSLILGYTQHF